MDMEQGYGDGENPVVLKSEFLLSLCEQLVGAGKLSAKEKSITDRIELARLLNIPDNQLSYITNVDFGHGLIKCGSAIVPFMDSFPRHTKLYDLMTTRPSDKREAA